MSRGATITVTGGIHTGASIALSDNHDLTIGSGDRVDLMLVDEGVEPHHITIRLSGDVLALDVIQGGVSVFGYPLQPGKHVVVRSGGWFSVGAATLQFAGTDPLAPDQLRNAELAWLRAHAPLAYIAKRWALAPRHMKLLVGLVPVSIAAWNAWPLLAPHLMRSDTPHHDSKLFRNVETHLDPKSGVPVYEGYVETSAELATLAAIARSNSRSPVIHVAVIEQMRDALSEFLEKYYRGAEIYPAKPGVLEVTLPSTDGYRLPESWDYARVARLARNQIDGLHALNFVGHTAADGPIRVPLESIGMNLVNSPHAAWLVDRQGGRYFAGARLPIGKITRITECVVVIVRDDDGSTYEFFASEANRKNGC